MLHGKNQMAQHEKLMTDRFSEEKQDAAAGASERREEAVNEAMRCLLEDLSELSSAVEELEKSSRQSSERISFSFELPTRK